MPRRFIIKVNLTGPAKQEYSSVSDRYGMTQLAVSSTLIERFASQSPATQLAILGVMGGAAEDAATQVLKSLAKTE